MITHEAHSTTRYETKAATVNTRQSFWAEAWQYETLVLDCSEYRFVSLTMHVYKYVCVHGMSSTFVFPIPILFPILLGCGSPPIPGGREQNEHITKLPQEPGAELE